MCKNQKKQLAIWWQQDDIIVHDHISLSFISFSFFFFSVRKLCQVRTGLTPTRPIPFFCSRFIREGSITLGKYYFLFLLRRCFLSFHCLCRLVSRLSIDVSIDLVFSWDGGKEPDHKKTNSRSCVDLHWTPFLNPFVWSCTPVGCGHKNYYFSDLA